MSTNYKIGFKIKQLRQNKKMLQAELAEQLTISQACLSSIENGDTDKIDYVVIYKICQIFDVNHEYFREDSQINTYNIKVNKGNVSTNHFWQCLSMSR